MGKILFLGNCCFDIVYYVDGYPAEDSDNRHILQINTLGGNVVNSMKICAQLDCRSQLFTALPEGNPVFDSLLQEYRIDASRCIRRNSKAEFPLTCVIVNSLTGSRTMFNSSKGIDWPTAQEFSQKFPNFDDFTWAHFEIFSGYSHAELLKMMQYTKKMTHQRAKNSFKISMELEHNNVPRDILPELIALADVVLMSKDFARDNGWTSMAEAVKSFQEKYNAKHATVICPWAELGAAGIEPTIQNGNISLIEVAGHEPLSGAVIDTLAAGDCFIGSAVHYLNERRFSLKEVLEKATFIAGESVGQKGILNLKLPE